MSRQNPDDLDNQLSGLFARASSEITPQRDFVEGVRGRATDGAPARPHGSRRGPAVAATLSAVLVVALLAGVFIALRNARTGTSGSGKAPAVQQFAVTSVNLTVNPNSIASAVCGSNATFTYTATFHVPTSTSGGVIQFNYTLNNGRSQTPATVQVGAGKTSAVYTFTSSGALSADHTYPGVAQVMVTSPSNVLSNTALPSGSCTQPSGQFQVTGVSMAISPASVSGVSCGTSFTETYTATFTLAANGPGGTIQFYYTVNNGRGDNPASLTVAPGQTTATYSFQWSGNLPPDHTAPEGGGVIVTSPNQLTSQLVGPSGQCS
jgi:hypothetical protein